MARMNRFWALLVSSLLCACASHSSDVPKPGDDHDGDRVLDVQHVGEGCYRVTLEVDPLWSCSEEEIEIAKSVSSTPGTTSPSDPDDVTPEDLLVDAALGMPVALEPSDCATLADLRRASLKQANHAYVERQYRRELVRCLPTTRQIWWQDGWEVTRCVFPGTPGTPDAPSYSQDGGYSYDRGYGSGGSSAVPGAPESTNDGASEYSTTNNQVAGVEEADYVKNDAGHIFVLTASDLRIIDSWPVADTQEIARVPFDAEPRRLLLAGDQLVVLLRRHDAAYASGGAIATSSPSSQGCTYGYDCRFQSEGGNTEVRVYDVSNPAMPKLRRKYVLAGGYVASRRIGDDVHVVVASGGAPRVPLPGVVLDLTQATDPGDLYGRKEALFQQIDEEVDALPVDELLPPATHGGDDASDGEPLGCDELLAGNGADGGSLLSIVSFQLSTLEAPHRTILSTKPGFVYASASALYVATDGLSAESGWYRMDAQRDVSVIHKFALGDGRSEYRGSVPVRGHVLNQFAMDEQDAVLRVATTSGWVPDPTVSSTITTITESNGKLVRLGELKGLAPTEDIRSVRFDGDRGFVVTFKKTDPLFVIGLSDPTAPTVLGELKIPGFSTYMHPLDRDHLLAVGFDAEDHGSFAYFQGIQIQIFDVSDLTSPAVLHKTTIGTRGSGSEALLNHLAFNYFAPAKALALPVTVCEGGSGGTFGTTMTFSGVIVFDIDLESGITERGRLPFADPSVAPPYEAYGTECYQWWSTSTSNVKRTIFFDDYLFGLSDAELRAAQLDALSDVLVTLPLGAPTPTGGLNLPD